MYLCLLAFCITGGISAQTQNSMTEVIPFKTIDGKIIVEATINGEAADFVLDLSGHNALLPEALKKLHINTEKRGTFSSYQDFVFKQVPVGKVYEMGTVAIGKNTFANDLPAFTLEDEPYLRKLGVMGVLSGAVFRTSVLTIDMQRKKITITQPYRPSYMKLNYRENFNLITGLGVVCPINIQGKPISLVLDTWSEGLVNLTEADFNTWNTQYTKGSNQKVSNGYKETRKEEESLILPETMFVKTKIEDAIAVKNPFLKRSVLGKKILDYGIISIDYIHQKIYFQPFDMVPIPEAEAKVTETKVEDGKLNPITRQFFLEHIFDYRKGNDFIYNGDKPIVIDFWATWCGPCMRLLPEREYNQAKTDYEDAKATRYWKSDEFEDAKTNLEEKNRVYTAAKNELTQAQNDLMDAEDAVTNYKPSSGSLVMEMLVEFLKPNFNINDMNKHMEDLVDYVLSIGEGEQIPSNYAEMVETVLEINNVLDDYSRLKNADDSESAEEKIKQLKIDVEEKLTIPNPQEDDFENTKTMWVAEWKTRLENLREIVWRIPSYSGEEIAAFSASGIEINKDALEYDSTDISNKIDRLERNKLTDINVMEKVCLLISGKYPLTAIVALLIAIELDMISLLVGVVIYWMSKVSKGTDKEIVLT